MKYLYFFILTIVLAGCSSSSSIKDSKKELPTNGEVFGYTSNGFEVECNNITEAMDESILSSINKDFLSKCQIKQEAEVIFCNHTQVLCSEDLTQETPNEIEVDCNEVSDLLLAGVSMTQPSGVENIAPLTQKFTLQANQYRVGESNICEDGSLATRDQLDLVKEKISNSLIKSQENSDYIPSNMTNAYPIDESGVSNDRITESINYNYSRCSYTFGYAENDQPNKIIASKSLFFEVNEENQIANASTSGAASDLAAVDSNENTIIPSVQVICVETL